MIHKLGLQESWFQFRQHALQQIAVNWLKENDIEYEWDTAEIIPPRKRDIEPAITVGEMAAILRAADSLIARGGRTLLVKILKGSKEKKVLELGLDKNPSAIRRR